MTVKRRIKNIVNQLHGIKGAVINYKEPGEIW